MSIVVLKYPCKIAGVLIPAGTELEALDVLDHRVQAIWPGMKGNNVSYMIAVQFPHVQHATLIHTAQVV
jgi:hypothetical protein